MEKIEPKPIQYNQISLEKLVELVGSPFEFPVWTSKPISEKMLKRKIDQRNFSNEMSPDNKRNCPEHFFSSRMFHYQRIAYFVNENNVDPICVEIDENQQVSILDGWHRLTAMLANNHKYIWVCFDGFLDQEIIDFLES